MTNQPRVSILITDAQSYSQNTSPVYVINERKEILNREDASSLEWACVNAGPFQRDGLVPLGAFVRMYRADEQVVEELSRVVELHVFTPERYARFVDGIAKQPQEPLTIALQRYFGI